MRRCKKWTREENTELKNAVENTSLPWHDIGNKFGVDGEKARQQYRNITGNKGKAYAFNKVQESPYPKFNSPLEQTGDCLILPDPEIPFHHAEFINRCLELADSWRIKQCCIAGDAMHFNSISSWEPNWKGNENGEISQKAKDEIIDASLNFPEKYRKVIFEQLDKLMPATDGDIGSELSIAKKAFLAISDLFDDIVYVIGNHDGRFLSALNSPMFADNLKQFVIGDNPKYRIAEYYYSILHTDKGDYSIEHPVSASKNTAVGISSKKLCHVLMGHSHRYSRLRDPSDNFWCIQMGMCCDEERMAYVGQRTRGMEKHSLGATIVRDGFPFDLSMNTPWELYKNI